MQIEYMPDGVLRETLKDVDDDNYLVIVVDEAHVIFELKHQVFKVVYTRALGKTQLMTKSLAQLDTPIS
ncbi:hypothetical protein Tco_0513989 [Tanacetum coccineum]